MKYIIPSILVLACIGSSCDPMRRINIRNKKGSEAEVTWVIKEDSLLKSPFYISNSKELKLSLGTKRPYNLVKLSCDEGLWKAKDVKRLVKGLDSLIIKTASQSLAIGNEKELTSFLSSRRKGFAKRKIEIVLK